MLERIYRDLHELLAQASSRCVSDSIALSGGLDSTILGYLQGEKIVRGVTVIASDFVATDLTYCQVASNELGIQLHINHASTEELLDAAEQTIRILGNFNDIEIRNSIVVYLAVKWAKAQGFSGIMTGDGADELFAGYGFLLNKSQEELEAELERICCIMHFPAQAIAKSLGMVVESPFLDREVIDFARNLPAGLKVGRKDGRTYGKWILRKAFEGHIPKKIAWREKSPMQDGAGTAGLTGMFDFMFSDEAFMQKRGEIQDKDGVTVRTKEAMHYYSVYRKTHGLSFMGDSGRRCPYCKASTKDSKFCRMCGAFPI